MSKQFTKENKVKVIKTQISGCCGPVIYSYEEEEKNEFKEIFEEIKIMFFDEGQCDKFTININFMGKQEFENLGEFKGY